MNSMKDLAVLAAREAGKILMEKLGKIRRDMKSKREMVTQADTAAEKKICELIRREFPKHSILAEESGTEERHSAYKWIIDPLDGTNNYTYGYPFFCISIALEHDGTIVLGIVYDPLRDELFEAELNNAALLNGRKIRVSNTVKLADSRLLTGFPYVMEGNPGNNLDNFATFALNACEVRVDGSAELDLCYVACGRADGYWELDLKPWDTAAGKLIVECAGGKVTNFEGRAFNYYKDNVLATNGIIHSQIIELLKGNG
jgi:myo-inositol-1(or 4)-monophosphatase